MTKRADNTSKNIINDNMFLLLSYKIIEEFTKINDIANFIYFLIFLMKLRYLRNVKFYFSFLD